MTFKFTKDYPDELPEIEIEETENIQDEDSYLDFLRETVSSILTLEFPFELRMHIFFQGEENMGMPMIYTMVSALVEKINKDNEDRKEQEENERDRIEAEREAEELVTLNL